MFKARVVQGQGASIPFTVSACPLDASLALVGTVSDGLTGPAILPVIPMWSDSGPPNGSITITPNQTAAIPPGGYVLQVGLANGGGPLVYGTLQVLAAPSNVPLFDVLTTPGRVLISDPSIANDPDRVAALPLAIRAASEIVRRYCYRRFTRGTYTEYHIPSLEGEIKLDEFPVNQVKRLSRKLDDAVTITADESAFQTAYANFITEDGDFSAPENVKYTGLSLVGASHGVTTTANLLFSAMTTLDDLIAAVNAVSGWTATTDGYGAWPIGELYCDATSQGALTDGVKLRVFSQDVGPRRVDRKTGFVYMGFGRFSGGFGPRWGPAWAQFDDDGGGEDASEVVRVVYDAGFTTVPDAIQNATVELTRLVIDRLLIDYTLKSESIGDYSYQLNDKLLGVSIPEAIRGTLALYVGHAA